MAGSFRVYPLRVNLTERSSTSSVTLNNTGTQSVVVEVSLVRWRQANNRDHYAPSDALIATPPIFRLAPEASQIIRIGSTHQLMTKAEKAFRLFITEVPPAPEATKDHGGVRTALRIALPVFVGPSPHSAPHFAFALHHNHHHLVLSMRNTGRAHVKITQVTLLRHHQSVYQGALTEYVLAGSHRSLVLKGAKGLANGTPILLRARTDQGIIHAHIVVGK
jgi:fimbrial chaperone protein